MPISLTQRLPCWYVYHNNVEELAFYHCWWCSDFFHREFISRYSVDCVGKRVPVSDDDGLYLCISESENDKKRVAWWNYNSSNVNHWHIYFLLMNLYLEMLTFKWLRQSVFLITSHPSIPEWNLKSCLKAIPQTKVWYWWRMKIQSQCLIWNLLYLSKKWSDCHKMKSKHIDWTLYLKNDNGILTLAMTLTLNCQGQLWNLL